MPCSSIIKTTIRRRTRAGMLLGGWLAVLGVLAVLVSGLMGAPATTPQPGARPQSDPSGQGEPKVGVPSPTQVSDPPAVPGIVAQSLSDIQVFPFGGVVFVDAAVMVQTLFPGGLPPGVTVAGEDLLPPDGQAGGIFTGGAVAVGIDIGVVLSTGDVVNIPGPPPVVGLHNESDSSTVNRGDIGGADLGGVVARATFDKTSLEFSITNDPIIGVPRQFKCSYVFASEEYNEWVWRVYDDVFAIFVNDSNQAWVRSSCGHGGRVHVNNVHRGNPLDAVPLRNNLCYINNDCSDLGAGLFPCEPTNPMAMDGLTTVLNSFARQFLVGETLDVRLAIADASDALWDSNVFINCSVDPIASASAASAGPRLGGCCMSDGPCLEGSPESCMDFGGTYQGDGSTCASGVGACMRSQTSCVETTPNCCTPPEIYLGTGTTCPRRGVCCWSGGACQISDESACTAGLFRGHGTVCLGDNDANGIDDMCEGVGACCGVEGCADGIERSRCEGSGGSYQGNGTECPGNDHAQNVAARMQPVPIGDDVVFEDRTITLGADGADTAGLGTKFIQYQNFDSSGFFLEVGGARVADDIHDTPDVPPSIMTQIAFGYCVDGRNPDGSGYWPMTFSILDGDPGDVVCAPPLCTYTVLVPDNPGPGARACFRIGFNLDFAPPCKKPGPDYWIEVDYSQIPRRADCLQVGGPIIVNFAAVGTSHDLFLLNDPGDCSQQGNFGGCPPLTPWCANFYHEVRGVENLPVEVDVFESSSGQMELQFPPPQGGSEVIALSGPTTVHVFFEGPNMGDANDDEGVVGLDEVQTQIVDMQLAGNSVLLGPVLVTLHPSKPSRGWIEEKDNTQAGRLDLPPFAPAGTADSIFDMFFKVQVGPFTFFTQQPKRLSSWITHKPPGPGDTYENLEKIPLLDEQGGQTGYSIGAARHIPQPPPPNDIVWNSDPLSPERTTRSLRFSVQAPVTATGSPGQSAIKVTMIDLQHPVPANLAANPPPNFTTYDTRLNGACLGGSHAGHHCDTDADCRLCVGGINANRVCTSAPHCPFGICPAGGTCAGLAACTAAGEANECARWVGKLGTFLESQDAGVAGGTYKAARLQCTPHYWDWKPEGLIAVYGAEITPSSEFSVQTYGASCKGAETGCANVSTAVTMYTRRSADVEFPFVPPANAGQPDVTDIAQLVSKFKNVAGAPVKAIAQLQPNLPDPNVDINALDIVAVVDAVKELAYSFSGPCACPSRVPCGITACASVTPCVAAYGVGATCVKTCSGGDNDGDPCIDNTHGHCPGGTCGNPGNPANPGFCRDRCGRCTP